MDAKNGHLYEVAVDAPLLTSLTYAGPREFLKPLPVGSVVLAPLGKRQVTGYILGPGQIPDVSENPTFKLRHLSDILSIEPFFPPNLVQFYRWIAQYYHYPLGEVIRTALPLAPGARSGRRVELTEQGRLHFTALANTHAAHTEPTHTEEPPWLAQLLDRGVMSAALVRELWRNAQDRRILLSYANDGLLTIIPELLVSGGRIKTEEVVCAEDQLAQILAHHDKLSPEAQVSLLAEQVQAPLRKSEQKLLALFCAFVLETHGATVPRSRLRQAYKNYGPALKLLVARGLFSISHQQVFRDPFVGQELQPAPSHRLTEAQHDALAPIISAMSRRIYAPFLLFGVTGSGKTEIYLQALARALGQGQSALLLVPEIALAAQLETDVRARFGEQVAVLHSGMADGERVDQWQRVVHGQARIVLGARSAVFAPLSNLGVIIVDEEHESSYKQEDGLPYHGRDLAVLRAKQEKCPILLGSATPALTSYHHAVNGRYQLLQLPERVSSHPLPQVQIVDMKAGTAPREHQLFSGELLSAMRKNLDQDQQTLLYLNRRGFASFMQCQDCGHVLECRHCRVSLTLHRSRNQLLCHYCGFHQPPNSLCPACGSSQVAGRGLGTERIEEEMALLFPTANIARVDSDSSRNRRQFLALLQAMNNGEIDILVGTQMIAKGLHFPNISLVGVLWADAGLSMPDFRAGERTFAQLIQVTGRAGRGDSPGRVIVQTYQPDHYAVRLAQLHDYAGLYAEEMTLRQLLGYPPFARLVNVRISGLKESEVEQAAANVAAFARDTNKNDRVTVQGAVPAPLAKIKDRVRWQVLLKSADLRALHQLCDALNLHRKKLCPASVSMQIDVDPDTML